MNIYSADEIKAWDAYTIQHEPIASIDLMERAAVKCTELLLQIFSTTKSFKIFCGKGNNGGDGLAIARLLSQHKKNVEVYILEFGKLGSEDFQTNLHRLHQLPVPIHFIQSANQFPLLSSTDIIIDAIIGSGLNKPTEGLTALLVEHINPAGNIISIDLPSGMFADSSSVGNSIIKATHTLTFQVYKKAFLVAENSAYTGKIHVLDIGLHAGYIKQTVINEQLVTINHVKKIYQPRTPFAHKGNFGHALLIGGSYGKMGAMLLATAACLRSGAGLVTTYIPRCGYAMMQIVNAEAMTLADPDESMITILPEDLEKYSIGIGPGMGTNKQTRLMVNNLIKSVSKPMVLDADALNSLALEADDIKKIFPLSIITPHPKEFDRLFGESNNDFERIEKAKQKAIELNIITVLKGHHTLVATPDGKTYYNTTGNAGMAKGGSGDALTGMITAFCAQGYTPLQAALLGVYMHGMAGDICAAALSMEAMIASDIIKFLPQAFKQLANA